MFTLIQECSSPPVLEDGGVVALDPFKNREPLIKACACRYILVGIWQGHLCFQTPSSLATNEYANLSVTLV